MIVLQSGYFCNYERSLNKKILMDHEFELSVNYQNRDFIFPSKFIPSGYSYKFEVDVNDISIVFEKDEERRFRAIIDPSVENVHQRINVELIKSIADTLEDLFK